MCPALLPTTEAMPLGICSSLRALNSEKSCPSGHPLPHTTWTVKVVKLTDGLQLGRERSLLSRQLLPHRRIRPLYLIDRRLLDVHKPLVSKGRPTSLLSLTCERSRRAYSRAKKRSLWILSLLLCRQLYERTMPTERQERMRIQENILAAL